VYEVYEGDTPQYRLGIWRGIFDTPIYHERFHPATEFHLKRTVPTTEQGVVDRVLSKSYVTDLSSEKQAKLEASVRKIVQKGEGRVWIDKEKGIFGTCALTVSMRFSA
jgi:hypothetical protein